METIKNYAIVVLLILVIVAGFAAWHFYGKAATTGELVKASKVLQDPVAPIVDRYTDSLAENHSRIEADKNDIPKASVTSNSDRKRLIDTVKEALNLANVNQIKELTQEVINLKDKLKLKAVTDSAGRQTLNYTDKWLSWIYNPLDSTGLLTYNAKLTSIYFSKRSWIPFVNGASYIDFYGDDPRMTINGVKHFRVIPPEPLFGFTADTKLTYLFSSGRVVPSMGADLRIKNFFLGVREYYNINTDQFHPAISAGYRFINH